MYAIYNSELLHSSNFIKVKAKLLNKRSKTVERSLELYYSRYVLAK